MAKKKKAAPTGSKNKKPAEGIRKAAPRTDLSCTMGGYAPNKKGGHAINQINVSIDQIKPQRAWELLAGSQLRVILQCDPNASHDVSGQQNLLPGGTDLEPITFIATCGGIGLTPERLKFSLSAPTVTAAEIAPFAFKSAKIGITRLGPARDPDNTPIEVLEPSAE